MGRENRFAKVEKIAYIPKLNTRSAETGSACLRIPIGYKWYQELLRFTQQEQLSLATILQSLWSILLLKYNDTDEVIFLVQKAARISPIKVIVDSNSDLITIAKQILLARKSPSFSPEKYEMFDHLLIIDECEQAQPPKNDFPLSVTIRCHDQCDIELTYQKQDYDEGYLQQLGLHFQHLLQQLLHHPRACIRDLYLLTPEEKQRIAYEFNQTTKELPNGQTIDQLVRAQAQKSPDRLAIVSEKGQLTYGELDQLSDRLAGYL